MTETDAQVAESRKVFYGFWGWHAVFFDAIQSGLLSGPLCALMIDNFEATAREAQHLLAQRVICRRTAAHAEAHLFTPSHASDGGNE